MKNVPVGSDVLQVVPAEVINPGSCQYLAPGMMIGLGD